MLESKPLVRHHIHHHSRILAQQIQPEHCHYSDVIMSAMAFQITGVSIAGSGTDKKKTSKLRATGPCVENSPLTGEFPAQKASNTENVSIWWRHHSIECDNFNRKT